MSLPLIERQTFTPGQILERPDSETVRQLAHRMVEATPILPPETPYFFHPKDEKTSAPLKPVIGHLELLTESYAKVIDPSDPQQVLRIIQLANMIPVQQNDWPHDLDPDHTVKILD